MSAQQPTQAAPAQAAAPPPAQAAAPPPPAGAPTAAPTAAPVKDDRDYVDKGLESAQQKYAGKYMPKDQKKVRAINEKITDFVRKFFEKKGVKVPKSVSN